MNTGFVPTDVEYKSGCDERGEQTEHPIQNVSSFYNTLWFFFSVFLTIDYDTFGNISKSTFILVLLAFCTVS